VCPLFLTRFVCCVLFERVVLFCVMCVICMLCLMVVSLPPGKNLFAVKIYDNNYIPGNWRFKTHSYILLERLLYITYYKIKHFYIFIYFIYIFHIILIRTIVYLKLHKLTSLHNGEEYFCSLTLYVIELPILQFDLSANIYSEELDREGLKACVKKGSPLYFLDVF
jgi:hypothetical protein